MCQQRTALDMIKSQKDHGGLSKAALLLHEKQCEDTEKMNKRIDEIEIKLDNVDRKIDEVKAIIISQGSFVKSLKEVLSNKVFLYLLIIFVASVCGVQVADLGTFVFK